MGTRRWLQQHITLLFRLQLAGGIGLLSVLAGWSFDVSVRNVAAIGVLLVAQLTSVAVAARLFRTRTDGALFSFWMFGNPTFWTAPVAAAALGAEAAVFVIAYDMLTQARIAVGVATCAPTRQVAVRAHRARRLRTDDLRDQRPRARARAARRRTSSTRSSPAWAS